ncbi:MAG: hypothetical protein H0W49_03915 [Nitrospirales bacterium]|nr:hypothetical protein [Nitrospirales bacterium]MBA3965131.1 hypothetical protein [Nitrospirales bacterium]
MKSALVKLSDIGRPLFSVTTARRFFSVGWDDVPLRGSFDPERSGVVAPTNFRPGGGGVLWGVRSWQTRFSGRRVLS